ncbi:MAG: cyclase [Candidatus Marinimicrobia bacterium]|nr:cyclase [Candidatus Neomarinimicrobiota bacterium]
MAFYVVNHKVKDFDAWKIVYDEFESTRVQYGVKEHFALQSVEDSNHVMVVGEGELEAIQRFLNSEDLKSGMEKAGIAGPPEIFIGENKR